MLRKEGRTSPHQPMSSGYFFDTRLSANDCERRARLFLELFGYSASDFKVLDAQDPAE